MDIQQILGQVCDALTVQRVFGEPYEKGGVTVIPVAALSGGGGGGGGEQADQRKGSGVGFGVNARPAGVYVIKGDAVSWVPAFDLNRVIMGGQIVAVLALLVLRPLFKAKARAAEVAARAGAWALPSARARDNFTPYLSVHVQLLISGGSSRFSRE